MAKKKLMKNLPETAMWVISLIVAIGVGGLFIDGAFMSVVLLKYLPLIVHQVVGWVIVGGTLAGAVMKLMK